MPSSTLVPSTAHGPSGRDPALVDHGFLRRRQLFAAGGSTAPGPYLDALGIAEALDIVEERAARLVVGRPWLSSVAPARLAIEGCHSASRAAMASARSCCTPCQPKPPGRRYTVPRGTVRLGALRHMPRSTVRRLDVQELAADDGEGVALAGGESCPEQLVDECEDAGGCVREEIESARRHRHADIRR